MNNNEILNTIYKSLREEGLVASQAHFGRLIGEDDTANLSKYLTCKKVLGDKIQHYAVHLKQTFPMLDPDWLRTGEGSMLRTPEATEELVQVTEDKGRPYYDVDFMGGYGEFLDNPSSSPVSYMIDYPPYNKDGVFYMNVRGDSMSPELISGEKVALRLVEDWQSFLFFGKIYGIVTRNGLRTIKRLRKGKDDDHYRLQATNPDYDDQEIPIAQIERVFEVLGSIREYE